ncbi:hypothetical protein G3G77_004706 [Salmonella enterica]|nr:hypothetical protein [Salmonella enterica]EEH5466486.1 hypothetical protein [Salmonella enterica]EEH7555971.1 hypothetical protein [Salmonella enterica]EEO5640121.1 hypothetical protein [Salmonella enterica]EEQ0204230.1 hypothetical protein [Salmonella enterica]
MKDDYHQPVITHLEREARRLGIKKKLAMVLGLNEREYNYISDGCLRYRASEKTPSPKDGFSELLYLSGYDDPQVLGKGQFL